MVSGKKIKKTGMLKQRGFRGNAELTVRRENVLGVKSARPDKGKKSNETASELLLDRAHVETRSTEEF